MNALWLNRREFIILFGGAAVAWPRGAWAQQPERKRRIGVLMNASLNDPYGEARLATFKQVLQQLGWNEGSNVQIDIRWGANDVERERTYAAELVALAPDVILAVGTLGVTAVKRETQTIPIVFNSVSDPIGAGVVDNLARPDGNVTGFMNFEYSLSGKWLELLKEIAPRVSRADRPVRRYSGQSVVTWSGCEPDRRKRPKRDRARRRGLCSFWGCWPDRDRQRGGALSLSDCPACESVQVAGGV